VKIKSNTQQSINTYCSTNSKPLITT
jgi:hypothetical protein